MTEYQRTEIHLAKGDIVTSKQGILQYSDLSKRFYLMFKGEYLGDGLWRSIKKDDCEAEEVKK